MKFVIIGYDVPNSLEKRKKVRPQHIQRLETLDQQGQLVLAGAFPLERHTEATPKGFSGSMMVVDFPSLETARAWADEEPYLLHGVYEKVDIQPFKQVFPK